MAIVYRLLIWLTCVSYMVTQIIMGVENFNNYNCSDIYITPSIYILVQGISQSIILITGIIIIMILWSCSHTAFICYIFNLIFQVTWIIIGFDVVWNIPNCEPDRYLGFLEITTFINLVYVCGLFCGFINIIKELCDY